MDIYRQIDSTTVNDLLSRYGKDFVFLHHTGNMFGMGCLANSKKALQRIKKLKEREDTKGFILLVPDIIKSAFLPEPGAGYASLADVKLSPRQQLLMQQYWPGNLTVCVGIKEKQIIKQYGELMENSALALRCPGDNVLRDFIRLVGQPVVSTSINVSNQQPVNDIEALKALDWFDFAVLGDYEKAKPAGKLPYSTVVGFKDNKLQCYREGSIDCAQVKQSYEEPLILFICTGNICRSPMAEFYAREIFTQKKLPFRTASAGVFASGYPISAYSAKMLRTDDIKTDSHRSLQISTEYISQACLVFTMEPVHKNILLNMFPNSAHKVFTLAEYVRGDYDVSDPFTKELDVYRNTYELIKEYIDELAAMLAKALA